MLAIAGHEGALNEIETSRLEGVINFENLKVKDVDTTPRINVTAFASNATYEEVYETVMNKPYTRYPVYEGDIDNIIGCFILNICWLGVIKRKSNYKLFS